MLGLRHPARPDGNEETQNDERHELDGRHGPDDVGDERHFVARSRRSRSRCRRPAQVSTRRQSALEHREF